MHPIQYAQTNQGNLSRSSILQHIQPGEELSREDLMNRTGLTYIQIRRQTNNLCVSGILRSRLTDGKRWYTLSLGYGENSVFPG